MNTSNTRSWEACGHECLWLYSRLMFCSYSRTTRIFTVSHHIHLRKSVISLLLFSQMNAAINRKRARLLEAKNELIRYGVFFLANGAKARLTTEVTQQLMWCVLFLYYVACNNNPTTLHHKTEYRMWNIPLFSARSEAQLRALQKDQSRLEQRLTDIRKGTTFLKDLGHLHKSYLDHRIAHPNQAEEVRSTSTTSLLFLFI